jgi:hypothetical protein
MLHRLSLIPLLVLAAGYSAHAATGYLNPVPDRAIGQSKDYFGGAVAMGDVTGDGKPDLVVGARFARGENGAVHVYSGADGSLVRSHGSVLISAQLGASVACTDVNRDGYADVIAGGPHAYRFGLKNAGRVQVFSGRDGSTLYDFCGEESGLQFGESVAAADLNGDGCPEVLVGAPLAGLKNKPGTGVVYAYSGKDGSFLREFRGPRQWSMAGQSIAVADLDRDGVPEVIAGAADFNPKQLPSDGSVLVFSGRTGGLLNELTGDSRVRGLGQSLAVGDVNGDGHPDVVTGAPGSVTNGQIYAGAVLVFSGRDSALLCQIEGETHAALGQSVAMADVNGDGRREIIAGAADAVPDDYRKRGDFPSIGDVRVYAGTGELLEQRRGDLKNDLLLGWSIATADLNHDGAAEVLAGCPNGGNPPGTALLFWGVPSAVH